MDPIFIFVVFIFFISLGFYAINIHYPRLKKLKYYTAVLFLIFGCSGWFAIMLGYGGLMTAVVSTGILIFSGITFSVAIIMDIFDKKKNKAAS